MTGKKVESHKDLKVFSGRAHPELAEKVAEELGIDLSHAEPSSVEEV